MFMPLHQSKQLVAVVEEQGQRSNLVEVEGAVKAMYTSIALQRECIRIKLYQSPHPLLPSLPLSPLGVALHPHLATVEVVVVQAV